MVCYQCGKQLPEGTIFCPACGVYVQPESYSPVHKGPAAENPAADSALKLGIVGACLSWIPVVSVVLGILAVRKANLTLQYANQGCNKRPMGIVGVILGIYSILDCVFFTVYWFILIALS